MGNQNFNSSRQYLDNNNPETLNSIVVSGLDSRVQDIIKRWTEEKERKAKEQEAKAKEEEQSKNKSSGFLNSVFQKVKDEMEKKRTIQNLVGIMQKIEKAKKLISIYDNVPKQAKDDFWSKKTSEEFRQKTNEFARISREEAMKDNKNFIIDDDGMPKILVQKGDTLSGIIRRQSPSISSLEMLKRVNEIAKLNNMENKDFIIPGQKLKVPESVLPDVTDTLNGMMREHAKDPQIINPSYIYDQFKTGGDWDFKSKPEYASDKYQYYTYNGEIINYDDIGNIHYGYVLNAVPWTTEDLVYFGAGAYQNWTDKEAGKDLSKKNQSFPIYGDNTNDLYAIYKGVERYNQDLYANMEDISIPKTVEELKWREYHPVKEVARKFTTEYPKNKAEYHRDKSKQQKTTAPTSYQTQSEDTKTTEDDDKEVIVK